MTDTSDDMWGEALADQAKSEQTTAAAAAAHDARDATSLDLLNDIPVELSVEIGRTRLTIAQILKLAQGSVVELDVLAGEPLNIYVNQVLIAQGEVVTVNDRFGIRLTDILSAAERAKRMAKKR
jgi:flagellar motor switch protein FliN/FliY